MTQIQNKKPPRYGMWRNTGWMIRLAWQHARIMLLYVVLLAALDVGVSLMELLIAPVILSKVETAAPFMDIVLTIAFFAGGLLILNGLKAYVDNASMPMRNIVRQVMTLGFSQKFSTMSYPLTCDPETDKLLSAAWDCTRHNYTSSELIWQILTDLLRSVAGFVIYLFMMRQLEPVLLVAVIATSVVSCLVSRRINQWGYRHRDESNALFKRIDCSNDTIRSRQHAKDIRIFGMESWLSDVYAKTLNALTAFYSKAEGIYMWANVVDVVLALLRNGLAYAVLIGMVLDGKLAASEFLLYFAAVSGFTNWVTTIVQKLLELHKAGLDISKCREFLDLPEVFKFDDGEKLEPIPTGKYEIRLKDVSFRYPGAEKDTISHMNLTLNPGEKLALVGLNGAGKTTLVKLMCGYLDPTEGQVLLNGQDIRKYDRRDIYRHFTAVFQDFSVISTTLGENITQNADIRDEARIWDCLAKAGLKERVMAMTHGLDTHIGQEIYEDGILLSGGETQRLMLARALYKDAPIIVLDEPTAALDPIAENDMYMKYDSMTKGRTSVYISHRLASTRFCDRIIYLENGGIAETGTHEQLLRQNGKYRELFDIQSQYYKEGAMNYGEEER